MDKIYRRIDTWDNLTKRYSEYYNEKDEIFSFGNFSVFTKEIYDNMIENNKNRIIELQLLKGNEIYDYFCKINETIYGIDEKILDPTFKDEYPEYFI
jgi:hypothetical protein